MTSENRRPGGETTAFTALASVNEATLHDAAVAYAATGIPVFPLRPRSKTPLTRHGLLDATTDRDAVTGWWSKYPNANIGAQTGVLFDVVDFDHRVTIDGHDDYTSRSAFDFMRAGGLMHAALGVSRTRHNGQHVFVRPSGRPTAHFPSAHMDVLATSGAVVLPPSRVHPDPGVVGSGIYRWVTTLDLHLAPLVPTFDAHRLCEALSPAPVTDPHVFTHHSSGQGLVSFVRDSRIGERNRRSFWAMCRAVESGVALEPLIDAAASTGLGQREVAGIARSAKKRAGGGRHV